MTTKKDITPVLYILMRRDIDSLCPGKMAAQACHAANACVYNINLMDQSDIGYDPCRKMLKEWQEQSDGQGFGTTIILSASDIEQVAEILNLIRAESTEISTRTGIIHDETYPLKDGSFTHLIPLDTCGYVFCRKSDAATIEILSKFNLYSWKTVTRCEF